jgi:tetratricopeptide (TPR) repeat protein
LRDADRYFTNLWNNTACPVELRFQALFAHGDTLGSEPKPENYEEAIKVFDLIISYYSTNQLAALALGQKASYALQLAQSSGQYDSVATNFLAVINSPQADARATNIATIGLAIVLEKMAKQRPEDARKLREEALNDYVNVFINQEQPEIFWTKFAGTEAGRLAFEMREWQKALLIYQKLQQIMPVPVPSIENRIQDCQRNLMHVSKE